MGFSGTIVVLLCGLALLVGISGESAKYYGPLLIPPSSKDMLSSHASVLECGLRKLTFARSPVLPKEPRDLFDALQLEELCNITLQDAWRERIKHHGKLPISESSRLLQHVYLEENENGNENEKEEEEEECRIFAVGLNGAFRTVASALEASRQAINLSCKIIELSAGIHFLNETLSLDHRDSGLTIRGSETAPTWLSSGKRIEIAPENFYDQGNGLHLLHTVLPENVLQVPSLFGENPHVRFQRARWPNGDTERDQWGYASPSASKVSIKAEHVKEWTKPVATKPPDFISVDLRQKSNPSGFRKNDSTMDQYNQYTSGTGNVCDSVWDTSYGSSYWCGNLSAGGWAEVDLNFAKKGTVGLPVGLEYYRNSSVGERIASWRDPVHAIVHAWHGQSWFTNMFEVRAHDRETQKLEFGRGGSQGGRSWCRCDQCGYAGRWCRKANDTRLISGSWYVENVKEELDRPGEFFFDSATRELWVLFNTTDVEPYLREKKAFRLIIPELSTLLFIDGADNVTLSNIGFRDTQPTFLRKHGVPSGGDWSLYKGGAVILANTALSSIKHCRFSRLDGTALMLLYRTRGVVIRHCEFEWLGESAMVAWGHTQEWDGRDGRQPRDTVVEFNVVREIGIYQKQSSPWFQAKTCNTILRNNLMFNLPRAAINFNDGFGGGNSVHHNVLFNTCRESGDHGAINSWDRQPFLWDQSGRYGFDTPPTTIKHNFILANYGASQGVDNDDGSSFYHIDENVFWGDGFKMDYGGHDSKFRGNLVLVRPYDGQNCFNVDQFKPGHAHQFMNNSCMILGCRGGCDELVGTMARCEDKNGIQLTNNTYYTKGGNASVKCSNKIVPLEEVQQNFGKEHGSLKYTLPEEHKILNMVKAYLDAFQIGDH